MPLIAVEYKHCLMVKTGCFWDTVPKFKEDVIAKHGEDSRYARVVVLALELLEADIYKGDE